MKLYEPYDGDYISDIPERYTKLLEDIQREAGHEINALVEIRVCIEVEGEGINVATTDTGSEWDWEHVYPVPQGWAACEIATMLSGCVYMRPI